jgi:hypothetical protein
VGDGRDFVGRKECFIEMAALGCVPCECLFMNPNEPVDKLKLAGSKSNLSAVMHKLG